MLQIAGNMTFSFRVRLLKNDLLHETRLKFGGKCKGLHTRTKETFYVLFCIYLLHYLLLVLSKESMVLLGQQNFQHSFLGKSEVFCRDEISEIDLHTTHYS